MKRMMAMVCFLIGLGGCTVDSDTITSAVGTVTTIVDLLKKFGVITLIVIAFAVGGCATMYPKFMDSPEFQKAAIQAFSESSKSMSCAANISNPEVEFYYKMSVGGRVIGVSGNIQGTGSTTGQTTTQPAKQE